MGNIQEIKIGSIYKKKMDEAEDVTPKGGMAFRPKYICTKELLDCQYPLRVKDYPGIFTIDPSLVNLARIREMEATKLLEEASFCGELTASDLQLILVALKESPVLTNKEKRRYG